MKANGDLMFGTKRQHELWKALQQEMGHNQAWLYCGLTIEMHLFAGDERIAEIAILDDDETCVPNVSLKDIPPEAKHIFWGKKYRFTSFERLPKKMQEQLAT